MPTQVQFRRGTTSQNNAFTGAAGEISVDTEVKTIRIHDGSTQGGLTLARADLTNTSAITGSSTTTLTNKTVNLTSNTLSGTVAQFNTALSDGDFATLAGAETLTNKTINGDNNTISSIANGSLTNSSITINGVSTSLGGTRTLVTDDIAEDGSPVNLWYTDTRSRAAVSVTDVSGDGSLSYNSGTGVITYTGPSASDVRAHFSGSTGVTITSGAISIGQAVGTGSNVTFNDLTVSGNLTVSGTTTSVNTETINLADNIIILNSNEAGTPTQDAGIEIERGTSTNASLIWDETAEVWEAGLTGAEVPLVTTSGTQTLTNKTINGSQLVDASVANAKLTNSTISGVALGSNLNALTIGTGLSGSSYTGAGAVTIAIDSTVATLTGTQTLTNKTLTSPTLTTPALGTPSSGTLTSCTGLPLTTGVTGTLPVANGGTGITSLGAGIATFLETPSSANLITAVTDETGTGTLVFSASPTFTGTVNAAALTLSGDLIVNGTTTTVNSNTVSIGDNILVLNSDEAGTPSQDAGIEIERGTSTNASLIWDETADAWEAGLAGAEVALVTVSGTQTLTNKTLTSPTMTAPALGTPASGIMTNVTGTASGLTAGNVTTNANLTGDVTSVGNATTIASGVVTSAMIVDGTIVNGDISASAAIVDTKLATISTGGKVSNSATTATNANTASAIVARDASGNFSAGTITAALTGNASTVTTNANLTGHVTSVGNAAVLGSFTSAQLSAALTDETGSGAAVFATSPTLVTPALGTPSSGVVTNLTGTASININGTVGATTATTASFTGTTFTLDQKSNTAFATPGALTATGSRSFASTVSGAAYMGFGTTNDVALMNRAGTVCLGVGPNTTAINIPGTLASGALTVTGAITATSEITAYFSDARLKDFHGTIDNALNKVNSLNGYYFTENEVAKSLGYDNDARQVGVSAQEVLAVMPEVIGVAPINGEYMAVRYEKLVPLLIEAIKELTAKVTELEKKN